LTSILLLSSIWINGIGNHVSFANTSKLVNDVQNDKEKTQYNAERVYSDTITRAKLNIAKGVYNKTLIDAKQSLDKIITNAQIEPQLSQKSK
jgi:hypothetical protein